MNLTISAPTAAVAPPAVVPPGAATLEVREPRTLPLGQGDRFVVVASDGSPVTSPTYASSNTGVVDVDRDGRVWTKAVGTATITVTAGGAQSSFLFTVTAAVSGGTPGGGTGGGTGAVTLVGLDVTGNVNLTPGASTQLRVTARMSDGTTADVTGQATWSSDSVLIQARAGGVVQVVGAVAQLLLDPDAVVTASYGGLSVSVTVRVTL